MNINPTTSNPVDSAFEEHTAHLICIKDYLFWHNLPMGVNFGWTKVEFLIYYSYTVQNENSCAALHKIWTVTNISVTRLQAIM